MLITELLDLLMTLAFLSVWGIVASDLIGRHGRDSRLRPAGDYRQNGSRRF